MSEVTFQPDSKVAKIVEAYAMDAIDLAASNFKVTLDWSEASVSQVEEILSQLHDEMASAQPPEDTVWMFAKAFGSYIGEVLKRHHGGTWGMVTMGGQSFPGLQYLGEALCWPWGKAHNRLINGPEDNVWYYCSVLVRPIYPEPSQT